MSIILQEFVMASTKKSPKFFCENCGAQVAKDAMFCNKCGKFFLNVRCPSCGYAGSQKDFINGCPKCGYAIGKNNDNRLQKLPKKHSQSGNVAVSTEALPAWVYVLTFGLLFSIIFGMFLAR